MGFDQSLATRNYHKKCSAFHNKLLDWKSLYDIPFDDQKKLLIRDEFAPVGIAQHWSKRRFALWAGIYTNRTVYMQVCKDNVSLPYRMPLCRSEFFNFDNYFSIYGLNITANFSLNAQFGNMTDSSSLIVEMRARNIWDLQNKRRYMHIVGLEGSTYGTCTGYPVTRPTRYLGSIVDRISQRNMVGMHIRTVYADNHLCFPDDTANTTDAVDRAFGNFECITRAFDHWRFKMLPSRRDRSKCRVSNLADVYPLGEWFGCAMNTSQSTVFISTDSPALERYVRTSAFKDRAVMNDDIGRVGHTHVKHMGKSPTSDVFVRAAADWYMLSRCATIWTPIQSAFSRSACMPYSGSCPIRFVDAFNGLPCKQGCFTQCGSKCTDWKPAYMGPRVKRVNP